MRWPARSVIPRWVQISMTPVDMTDLHEPVEPNVVEVWRGVAR
jgi:hypothetical protein